MGANSAKSSFFFSLDLKGRLLLCECRSLTSIGIPDTITFIGDSAFEACSKLTCIHIPETVTIMKDAVFRYCSSLTSINIPNGVTSIGDYAFFNCTSLTSITIPASVTSIGKYAFQKCKSLTDIYYCGDQWYAITIKSNNTELNEATLHSSACLSDNLSATSSCPPPPSSDNPVPIYGGDDVDDADDGSTSDNASLIAVAIVVPLLFLIITAAVVFILLFLYYRQKRQNGTKEEDAYTSLEMKEEVSGEMKDSPEEEYCLNVEWSGEEKLVLLDKIAPEEMKKERKSSEHPVKVKSFHHRIQGEW